MKKIYRNSAKILLSATVASAFLIQASAAFACSLEPDELVFFQAGKSTPSVISVQKVMASDADMATLVVTDSTGATIDGTLEEIVDSESVYQFKPSSELTEGEDYTLSIALTDEALSDFTRSTTVIAERAATIDLSEETSATIRYSEFNCCDIDETELTSCDSFQSCWPTVQERVEFVNIELLSNLPVQATLTITQGSASDTRTLFVAESESVLLHLVDKTGEDICMELTTYDVTAGNALDVLQSETKCFAISEFGEPNVADSWNFDESMAACIAEPDDKTDPIWIDYKTNNDGFFTDIQPDPKDNGDDLVLETNENGCSATGSPSGGSAFLLLLGLMVGLKRRRR